MKIFSVASFQSLKMYAARALKNHYSQGSSSGVFYLNNLILKRENLSLAFARICDIKFSVRTYLYYEKIVGSA